jgi:predicted 3-demethylubiquinone-9 3-methyltransferase (glyoxalase superfamily)
MQKIKPCLWFDGQAVEAAKFYTSLFNGKLADTSKYGEAGAEVSGQKEGSVMVQEFEIAGLKVMGLNGGPLFKFNPSFSFFVSCDSEQEINSLWASLSEGGEVRMGLDKYPWAPKYGWTTDRFGVEWQLIIGEAKQKIVPAFLFVDELFGKGEAAVQLYTSLFKSSGVDLKHNDPESKAIMHCRFHLAGQEFVLMEGQGKHGHKFSEAFSLAVACDTQEEIDYFWENLTKNGGAESQCGWLKDRFGVSWQIIPSMFEQLFSGDPGKAERTMKVMLEMKKLDIEKLKRA